MDPMTPFNRNQFSQAMHLRTRQLVTLQKMSLTLKATCKNSRKLRKRSTYMGLGEAVTLETELG
jgi:hypothetical protein